MIERAIDSAKHRQYKLSADLKRDISSGHRKKAEKQIELMEVTVMALERMLAEENVVDEFAEELCNKLERSAYTTELKGREFDLLTLDGAVEIVCEIAEKMKGEEHE